MHTQAGQRSFRTKKSFSGGVDSNHKPIPIVDVAMKQGVESLPETFVSNDHTLNLAHTEPVCVWLGN